MARLEFYREVKGRVRQRSILSLIKINYCYNFYRCCCHGNRLVLCAASPTRLTTTPPASRVWVQKTWWGKVAFTAHSSLFGWADPLKTEIEGRSCQTSICPRACCPTLSSKASNLIPSSSSPSVGRWNRIWLATVRTVISCVKYPEE